MGQGYLIGLDAGGGSGRCLVLDVETGAVSVAMRSWSHPTAPGTGSLGRDLELDSIWAKLAAATHEAMERAGTAPNAVLGIAARFVSFYERTITSGDMRSPLSIGTSLSLPWISTKRDAAASHLCDPLARDYPRECAC